MDEPSCGSAAAPCACCSKLQPHVMREQMAQRSGAVAHALSHCRACELEEEENTCAPAASNNSSNKQHGKKSGGKGGGKTSKGNSNKQNAAASAPARGSFPARYVCLTCGFAGCEGHANDHFTSTNRKKARSDTRADHSVFVDVRTSLPGAIQGQCFHCGIRVGSAEPDDDEWAQNIDGVPVNAAGHCVDYVDYISDTALVVLECIANNGAPAADSDDAIAMKKRKKGNKRGAAGAGVSHGDDGMTRAASRAFMKQIGAVGLGNMGNTCFLNATLQCLARCDTLHAAVEACDGATTRAAGPLGTALSRFMLAVRDDAHAGSVVTPHGLFGQLCQRNAMFREHGQQDAQEALSCLVNGIIDEYTVKRVPLEACAVAQAIGGKLAQAITCQSCNTTRARTERFIDLSVAIAHSGNIEAALRRHFEPEALSGSNAYACERCHADRYADEQRRVAAERAAREAVAAAAMTDAPTADAADLGIERCDDGDDEDDGGSGSDDGTESESGSVGADGSEAVATGGDDAAATPAPAPPVSEVSASPERPATAAAAAESTPGTVLADAVLHSSIQHLQSVLVVHLKRFTLNMRALRWVKDNQPVRFPLELDVASLVTAAATSPEEQLGGLLPNVPADVRRNALDATCGDVAAAAALLRQSADVATAAAGPGADGTTLRLVGVVVHLGSVEGGHYVAYTYAKRQRQWMLCNDATVSPATEAEVLRAEAYVLFYERDAS